MGHSLASPCVWSLQKRAYSRSLGARAPSEHESMPGKMIKRACEPMSAFMLMHTKTQKIRQCMHRYKDVHALPLSLLFKPLASCCVFSVTAATARRASAAPVCCTRSRR
eukprot:5982786-Pleurochrysis_carterae.AAC.1